MSTAPSLFSGTSGPHDAAILICGESWGRDEREHGLPFVGLSGGELDKLLAESGLSRDEVFCTNIVNEQPPSNDMAQFFYPTQEARANKRECVRGLYPKPNVIAGLARLRQQLIAVKPRIVVGLGNYTLWALTSNSFKVSDKGGRKIPTGITAWRGSQLYCRDDLGGFPLMPTFHPAAIFRTWPWRYAIKHDLSRRLPKALRDGEWEEPKRDFIIRPDFATVMKYLYGWRCHLKYYAHTKGVRSKFTNKGGVKPKGKGPLRISVDIETRAGHIACISLATSTINALCIPFMCAERPEGYWPEKEEFKIISVLREILTHPNVELVGQNFLFDAQYFAAWWLIIVDCAFDTMLMHHVCWPGTPMGLGYLSSLYCAYHRYWKDEGKIGEDKEWGKDVPEEQLWHYCCIDSTTSLEISYELDKLIAKLGLQKQAAIQMQQFAMLLRMMLRGVLIDTQARAEVTIELAETIASYEQRFDYLIPDALFPRSPKKKPWWRSPLQQAELFYEYLHIKSTSRYSMTDKDLDRIGKKEPLLSPLTTALQEYRSLGVFHNTFCKARIDPDKRMRCSYNPTARTFRYKSSKNAWGRGGNLQNLPSGTEMEE